MIVTFYQHQLGTHWKQLAPQMMPWVDQFYMADALRDRMFVHEPALAVLTPGELQQASTTADNRQLQQRMAIGFDKTRDSIGKVEKGLQNDKDGSLA